jgi:hypothetical protein
MIRLSRADRLGYLSSGAPPVRPPVAALSVWTWGVASWSPRLFVRSVMLRVPGRLRVSSAPRWQPDRLSGTVSGWRWSFT